MWICLLSSLALAGVPVIVDTDDSDAASSVPALVAQRTGLPASQISVVRLDDLLTVPPQALGQAVMRRCAGQPTRMEDIRAELLRAQAAWEERHRPSVFDHLDLGVALMGCLCERVDPAIASQVFLFRGALEAERDQPDAAKSEMLTALAFDPDLLWSNSAPVEGQAPLAQARQMAPQLAVEILPPGTTSGPWIDGREVGRQGHAVAVAAGLHLAQYASAAGIRSAWMVVAGDSSLVLPGSFRRPILELLADPDTRSPIETLLRATLPDFQAAYVAHNGWLWLLTLADDRVDTTQLISPPPPVDDTRSKLGKHRGRHRGKK